MSKLEIVRFSDRHLDDAAELLARRHARHRELEPLLPEVDDFRAAIEGEWHAERASGVFASSGGRAVAYLIGNPSTFLTITWLRVGIAGVVIETDPEAMRDLYAAAAQRWVDEGYTQHAVFVPSHDTRLIDAWFRLSFGASAYLAARETAGEEPYDGGVEIRPGTRADFETAARLEIEMNKAMMPAPSFSGIPLDSLDAVYEEWLEDGDSDEHELFVAEREGRIVGHSLLYRRPPDLRVPTDSIDLGQASTEPEARGTGVGRALTAHVIRWANEHGYPRMTTDWRITNLWASRFWPNRGFRPTFLRLYRAIP